MKMESKTIIYIPNVCPYCESKKLTQKSGFVEDSYLKVPLFCLKCGKRSIEKYYIEYCETEGGDFFREEHSPNVRLKSI